MFVRYDERVHHLHLLLFGRILIGADSSTEITLKDTSLKVDRSPPAAVGILLLKVGSFGELPGLDANEEEEGSNEDYTPFPADALVPKDNGVDNRDV